MAEAAVKSISAKYFCHSCSKSIDLSPNIVDLTCPTCNSGFIEELTQELEESNIPSANNLLPQDYIASLFSALSMPSTIPRRNSSIYDSSDEEHNLLEFVPRQNHLFRRHRPDTPTLEHRLPRFLETIFSSIGNNEPNWLSNILNSNLDDYVWGENGLDNIITQLLNQMDGPSPPPASDADIENLENVFVDTIFLEKTSHCSICMEAFNLEDTIKKLPCIHFFHVDCILPWLKLHGTCPICRQIINSSSNTSDIPLVVSIDKPLDISPCNFAEDTRNVRKINENEYSGDDIVEDIYNVDNIVEFRPDYEIGGECYSTPHSDSSQGYDFFYNFDNEKGDTEKMDADDA